MTTATDRLRGHHDQDRQDQDHPIPVSGSVHPDFCASYVNYYICNNRTVLVPQFHLSPYDENAIQIFKDTFPDTYTILPIPIHTGIACGGGGIHCVTLQQPSLL
jgi:agmatine deiminase